MIIATTPQYHLELRPLLAAIPGISFDEPSRLVLSITDDFTGVTAAIELHDGDAYDLAVALTVAAKKAGKVLEAKTTEGGGEGGESYDSDYD